jgi:hypothetical protein
MSIVAKLCAETAQQVAKATSENLLVVPLQVLASLLFCPAGEMPMVISLRTAARKSSQALPLVHLERRLSSEPEVHMESVVEIATGLLKITLALRRGWELLLLPLQQPVPRSTTRRTRSIKRNQNEDEAEADVTATTTTMTEAFLEVTTLGHHLVLPLHPGPRAVAEACLALPLRFLGLPLLRAW